MLLFIVFIIVCCILFLYLISFIRIVSMCDSLDSFVFIGRISVLQTVPRNRLPYFVLSCVHSLKDSVPYNTSNSTISIPKMKSSEITIRLGKKKSYYHSSILLRKFHDLEWDVLYFYFLFSFSFYILASIIGWVCDYFYIELYRPNYNNVESWKKWS